MTMALYLDYVINVIVAYEASSTIYIVRDEACAKCRHA